MEEIGCHDGGICTEVTEFLIRIQTEDCARTNNFLHGTIATLTEREIKKFIIPSWKVTLSLLFSSDASFNKSLPACCNLLSVIICCRPDGLWSSIQRTSYHVLVPVLLLWQVSRASTSCTYKYGLSWLKHRSKLWSYSSDRRGIEGDSGRSLWPFWLINENKFSFSKRKSCSSRLLGCVNIFYRVSFFFPPVYIFFGRATSFLRPCLHFFTRAVYFRPFDLFILRVSHCSSVICHVSSVPKNGVPLISAENRRSTV